ncbi:MAG: bifunctional ornithine acetyltransferase/N-acetylglutamate synthase, partial [Oscillospiraceae bacterium]|nr:bifunctional ornithine acetyltransferase/N-acetylglutamate synthase [Oscillospiraceae bacterium]
AAFDQRDVGISIGDVDVCEGGAALPFDEAEAKAGLSCDPVLIRIRLGGGPYGDAVLTCDLTEEYVRINGSYRS